MAQQSMADTITGMAHNVRLLGFLYMEKGRLLVTEKLTILLSTIVFWGVITLLGLVCLVFASIGIGQLLATTFTPYIAYLIIAAFYVLVIIIIAVFRQQIFVDPIARFMSRLIVEKPAEEHTANDTDNADPANTPDDHDNPDKKTYRP